MERKLRKSKDKAFTFFIFSLHMERDGESGRQRNGRVCSRWLQVGGEGSFTQQWEIHQYQIALPEKKHRGRQRDK